jgi:cytochrome c oxidase subunit 3
MLAVGTTVWLASELMFFAGLFASYFTIRANDPSWPGPDPRLATGRDAGFTALLVASSFTMQLAGRLVGENRRQDAARWLGVTFALGTLFLANQGVEWATMSVRPGTSSYGSLFFIMTGFHGLHVALGLVAMGGLALRVDDIPHVNFEVVTYYWHFVDVVWLGLFATLFFVK